MLCARKSNKRSSIQDALCKKAKRASVVCHMSHEIMQIIMHGAGCAGTPAMYCGKHLYCFVAPIEY